MNKKKVGILLLAFGAGLLVFLFLRRRAGAQLPEDVLARAQQIAAGTGRQLTFGKDGKPIFTATHDTVDQKKLDEFLKRRAESKTPVKTFTAPTGTAIKR